MERTIPHLLVFALLLLTLPATHCAAESRPNIILIVADDLGVNDLACYGRADHRTPYLDRLAAGDALTPRLHRAADLFAIASGHHDRQVPGAVEPDEFSAGSRDAPSQRVLQPRIEGQLPLEEVTIAELLHDAGYATGLFGKWHLGGPGFEPEKQGFDVAVSPRADNDPTRDTGGKGEFAITAAASKFIEDHQDRPFFCYVPHNNPHIPLAAAPGLIEKNRDAFHPVYAAMIETLDAAVGQLLAKVDSLGMADRTIVVFTSDNGGLHVLEFPGTLATYNRPYRAGKGYLYEGGLANRLLFAGLALPRPAAGARRPSCSRTLYRRCWKRPASIRRKRWARSTA